MAIAAPTPSHTHLRASRRFDLTRNATRIITTIAGFESLAQADQSAAEHL